MRFPLTLVLGTFVVKTVAELVNLEHPDYISNEQRRHSLALPKHKAGQKSQPLQHQENNEYLTRDGDQSLYQRALKNGDKHRQHHAARVAAKEVEKKGSSKEDTVDKANQDFKNWPDISGIAEDDKKHKSKDVAKHARTTGHNREKGKNLRTRGVTDPPLESSNNPLIPDPSTLPNHSLPNEHIVLEYIEGKDNKNHGKLDKHKTVIESSSGASGVTAENIVNTPTYWPTYSPTTEFPTLTPIPLPSGQNLVVNPGFENGRTNGWINYGGASIKAVKNRQPRHGSYLAAITGRTQGYQGIGQEMGYKLIAGVTYEVSAFVKLSSAPSSVKLTFREGEGGSYNYRNSAWATVQTANEWVELKGSYTASNDDSIFMYLEGPPGGVNIFVDTVFVVAADMVQNPGFEDGTTSDWSATKTGSISAVTSPDPQSGIYSAFVTGRVNTFDGIKQKMADKLVPGQSYTVSAYVQLPSAPHSVELNFWEGDGEVTVVAQQTVNKANEWVQLTGSYTAASGSSLVMRIVGPPGGVDMLVDSVSAIPVGWGDKINSSIEQIRKRDAIITVQDADGSTIEGAVLDIQQVRRHFAFGSAASWRLNDSSSTSKVYKDFFVNNFEWMVPENEAKWWKHEGRQGKPSFGEFDSMVAFCHDHDIKVRGHAITWAKEGYDPGWVYDLDYKTFPEQSELLTAVESRITSVVSRYAGDVLHWDVNNEMLHGSLYQTRLGHDIRPHMFNLVKEMDPNTLTFVNDYNVIPFEYGEVDAYKRQIQDLISEGAKIDAIGVQGHFGSEVNPQWVKKHLDSLAELGLPIWITEYDSVTSNVQQRADNLEALYRVAFAHPAVEGVLMWGFWAGAHWRGADAVIVDMDWTVNAAGLRYQQLMAEWKTSLSGLSTDLLGETSFRGFHGKYDVTVTYPDSTVENHQIYLSPGSGTQSFNLQKGSTTTTLNTSSTAGPIATTVGSTTMAATSTAATSTAATSTAATSMAATTTAATTTAATTPEATTTTATTTAATTTAATTTTTDLGCTGTGIQIGGVCLENCHECCWGYEYSFLWLRTCKQTPA